MTTSETPIGPGPTQDTEPASAATIDQLQESYRSLRSLFLLATVSMLILTSSLFVFLLREVSAARRQVSQLTQYVAGYEKNSVPRMRQFRDKLVNYAKSDPDFVSILSKYVNPTNYATRPQTPGASPSSEKIAPVRIPTAPTN